MHSSAHVLFNRIIDYAGLFPPAQLPMDQAFTKFQEHHSSSEGWMLARFVCPATRLEELEVMLASVDASQHPVTLAVLGRGGETLEGFLESTNEDTAIISEFANRQGDRVNVDVFEVRLPEAGGVVVAVEGAVRRIADWTPSMTPYFEASLLGDWRPRLPAAVAAVRDSGNTAGESMNAGLKIRCGGLEATAVPPPDAVAAAIAICRATGVPLKATQGLHHPIRHHDPSLETMVHGFLNLFVASVLADTHDLSVTQLIEIVSELDPTAFVFSEDGVRWRSFEATSNQVSAARGKVLTSFGSCSFSEPRNELKTLNLL
jgi:hypothetical protein